MAGPGIHVGLGVQHRVDVVVVLEALVRRQAHGNRLVPPVHRDQVHVDVDDQVRFGGPTVDLDVFLLVGLADVLQVVLVLGIVVGEVGRIEASEHAFPHRALDLLGGHPSVERVGDDQLQVLDAGARGHLDHLLDDQLADVRSFHRRERDRYVVERDRQPHPCLE